MSENPDPAAVFAAAWSLHEACVVRAKSDPSINLSASYKGGDEFLRQVMRIGDLFERWACEHVKFTELEDVWPYHLQDDFGAACLEIYHAGSLMHFDLDDCLRVALKLRLPVRAGGRLPVPLCVDALNPNKGARFARFRIQTVRQPLDETGETEPFTAGDEPFDEGYGEPFFGIYGVTDDGLLEHIADLTGYDDASNLLISMMPEISLPREVVFAGEPGNAVALEE